MRLPSNYPEIVAAGVGVLRAIGTDVRAAAAGRPDAPELWLVVRDYEGLAGRLSDLDERDEREWQDGFGLMFITGQDLGVSTSCWRRACLSKGRVSSPSPRSKRRGWLAFVSFYNDTASAATTPVSRLPNVRCI